MLKNLLSFVIIFSFLIGVCCFLEDIVGLNFYGFDRESIKIFPITEKVFDSDFSQNSTENYLSDTLHVSLSSVYLISNGGKIDADCENEYQIIIESQDNQNFNSYSRLIYHFSTKEEYISALEYINRKGHRWILGHQFEKECSWNSPHEITFEKKNEKSITVNNMYLSHIKK